jgi:1-deoxy-D-xylulose-5-phosphate synthase
VEHGEAVEFGIGEAQVMREGADVAILAIGSTVLPALSAALRLEQEGVIATVVNMRFIKPLDRKLIAQVAASVPRIITVEDNSALGGFGSAVLEFLAEECRDGEGMRMPEVKVLGLPDEFIEHGTQKELRAKYSIDEDGIYSAALAMAGKDSLRLR